MPATPQNYANHRRYFPLYHYFVAPVIYLYGLHTVVYVVMHPELDHVLHAIFGLAVAAAITTGRMMSLAVQNRVIRLEMRLRLKEILPAPLAARINELRVRQIVALRFASDAEMPALVERVLSGELVGGNAIKQAVRDWQPDYLRA